MGRGGGKKRRRGDDEEEEEEEEEEMRRYKGVRSLFDDEADEAGSDEDDDDDDGDDNQDGFFVHGEPEDEIPDDYEPGEIARRSPLARRIDQDDDEDVEAMEKMVNERYNRAAKEYDDDDNLSDETSWVDQQSLLPSVCDPKLWMVKCLPGREKEVAASLMRKSVDKGSEMRILSAIALDHLQNYIYVEAYKEADVREACKGMHYIFSRNITMVPVKEMSNVLLVESKRVINVSKGDWVRLKRSTYKGSLAKVVGIDEVSLRVTVKVTPKMSSLSLDDKLDGINSFFKTVALSSLDVGNIHPSIDEVQDFIDNGEDDAVTTLFKEKNQDYFIKGDSVKVVKGELKNLEGLIEHVDGDLVHIKPNVNIPMETVTVRKTELVKHFEPGSHVKVVHGVHEGSTGLVVKVDQTKLIILSDASMDQITVRAGQVIISNDISEKTSIGVGYGNREKPLNSSNTGHIPQPAFSSRPPPGPRSGSTGRGAGQYAKRQDSKMGKNVKIIQGPYRGYRGCIKGVNGNSIRVELEAQMKVITVDRSHISDNLPATSTNWKMQQDRTGSETPLYPRTPMHSMGGETPWRTPRRPSTPVHYGSASPACEYWNPLSFASPTRLTPTP